MPNQEGCQGRVLIFSPDTSWGTLCSGWEGQTSADKEGMLSDLEARIRCFSPQSNPQRTSSRIPPSIWRTEEPPTAGRMEALPQNTRSFCPVTCQGPSRQSHKTVTAWSHCIEHTGDGERGGLLPRQAPQARAAQPPAARSGRSCGGRSERRGLRPHLKLSPPGLCLSPEGGPQPKGDWSLQGILHIQEGSS